MLQQMMFEDMSSVIGLPGSQAGPTPCGSPDGPMIAECGPGAALVNRSVLPGPKKVPKTRVISGRISSGSSASVALTSSLVSRLQARLGTGGSMEYAQTWKEKVTPLGIAYWAHTASGRRTKDSASTGAGWPTPNTMDTLPPMDEAKRLNHANREGRTAHCNLREAVAYSGWATPSSEGSAGEISEDLERRGQKWVNSKTGRVLQTNLATDVKMLSGWASPSSRDWKDTPGMSETGMNPDGSERTRLDQLPRQATLGQTPSGFPAAMEKPGALNPAFPCWLMGFPPEWCDCAVTAMQSCRKSPKRSSKRT